MTREEQYEGERVERWRKCLDAKHDICEECGQCDTCGKAHADMCPHNPDREMAVAGEIECGDIYVLEYEYGGYTWVCRRKLGHKGKHREHLRGRAW